MKQVAQGIAALGRGNDTQLVHMTPNEVGAMQNFAMSQGGSLTTNPHTGLPEAGFLDKMLPTLLGVGASLLLPGVAPWMIGAGIGGLQAARTGDIGEGITAGLGAYGGAGITGGLASMGSGAVNTAGVNTLPLPENVAANMGATNVGASSLPQTTENIARATQEALPAANQAFGQQAANIQTQTANMPTLDKVGEGFKQLGTEAGRTAFGDTVGFGKVAAAAAPAIADAMQPQSLTNNPMASSPGDKYSYVYDQKTGTYGPPKITHYSAEGGEIKSYAGKRGSYVPKSASVRGSPYEDDEVDMLSRDRALQELIASLSGTNPMLEAPYTRMAQGGVASLPQYAAGGDTTSQYSYDPSNQTYTPPSQPRAAVNTGDIPFGDLQNFINTPPPPKYSYDPNQQQYTKMAGGGIAALGGEYAAGGKLLQGPGDGMSDSIPAVIKGPRPQRAALAQGEFVIPADVVSHLGNGSTDAGAKQLYAMMDKIRHARTGNKKQGKQINPAKFIPA